jgi:serine protease Do
MTQKELSRIILTTMMVAIVTTLITGAGFILWLKQNPQSFLQMVGRDAVENSGVANGASPESLSSEKNVINAVKKANPAVVAITISKNVPVYEKYSENVPGPFGDFFGFSIPRYRENGTEKKEVGGGSGFLVSADGYIITNRHVVEDERAEYTVLINDGKKYTATVVARDPVLDLAVIKINGSNFPFLTFGNSDTIEVGESVIAIGNALAEFRNTVSVGIISGLSRSIVASDGMGTAEALDQLIQIDAAINAGNSGGPLLNLSGEVIGVNVAVASGAQSIGFALSGNSVKSIVESVQKNGRIIRPYLGVRYIPITEDLQKKNNLPVDYGVLVQRGQDRTELAVIPASPADKAGIVENDIILEIDGAQLTTDKNLAGIIRGKKVGDAVTLKISRAGTEKTVTLTLEEMK